MITLENVLAILERYGIRPDEVVLPRHIYAVIIREVQRIVAEDEQGDVGRGDYE